MPKNDTIFCRFIAIVLIVNSHLDMFYPVPFLASGGMIGNSIFFMLSAFGLYLSEQKNHRNFNNYFSRRIRRIYPPVWIILILIYIPYRFYAGEFTGDSVLELFGLFFYPPFWFLKAIMVFYIFVFFVIKDSSAIKLSIFGALSSIIYMLYYTTHLDLNKFSITQFPFRIIFYLLIVLYGIWLAKRNIGIKYSGPKDYILCFSSVMIIYGHKFLMTKNIFMSLQFVQHLAVFPFLFFLLRIARSEKIQDLMKKKFIYSPIQFISNRTLEIYIAHTCIRPIFIELNFSFPVNIVFFITASLGTAILIKRFAVDMLKYITTYGQYPLTTSK